MKFLNRCVSDFSGLRWKISGSSLLSRREARNLTAERMKLVALSAWEGGEGVWLAVFLLRGVAWRYLVGVSGVIAESHEGVVVEDKRVSRSQVHVKPRSWETGRGGAIPSY